MGLNLSNLQIAHELDLNEDDVQQMTTQLREGINDKKPPPKLEGSVESDEIYIVAGHKGNPEAVRDKGRKGRRNRLKGARGRGTLAKEKPKILGLIQRGGDIALTMLENVKLNTIKPIIRTTIAPAILIYTDEYDIYGKLTGWGYQHKTVCHRKGEFARDEDGEGFCEVHVKLYKDFSPYCGLGCVLSVIFHKKNCHFIWDFLNLFIM